MSTTFHSERTIGHLHCVVVCAAWADLDGVIVSVVYYIWFWFNHCSSLAVFLFTIFDMCASHTKRALPICTYTLCPVHCEAVQ